MRIRFRSSEAAYARFHDFPPEADFIEGSSSKRDGDCQVLLLRVADARLLDRFLEWCSHDKDIVEVRAITEEEFWRAPSNAV